MTFSFGYVLISFTHNIEINGIYIYFDQNYSILLHIRIIHIDLVCFIYIYIYIMMSYTFK